jgi:hypothetical protein
MEVSFCKTTSFNADNFEYETVRGENGYASMIKFPIDESQNSPGDVIVILDGDEIQFHGIIGKIEEGYAYAYDPKGSTLPTSVQ